VVTLTGFQLGSIGTASRGMCQGPRNNQIDLSLYKNFDLPITRSFFSDGLKLQFRIEFFNTFNHTQFRSVDSGYNASAVSLDDPTLDAMGNASNATRIIGASPEWNLRASNSNPRTTRNPVRAEGDFLENLSSVIKRDPAPLDVRDLRLIQEGAISRCIGNFWEDFEASTTHLLPKSYQARQINTVCFLKRYFDSV
jgi:hypothetical protein